MSIPAPCHHDEGHTWHPAEPDVGQQLGYFQCDSCDAFSRDYVVEPDEGYDRDGWHRVNESYVPIWNDCDCCECDPLQPDEDDFEASA